MAQSHAQWQLQQDTLTLTGALDRDSVPSLWAFAQQWKPSQKELECSLEEIERVDSRRNGDVNPLIRACKKAKLSYNAQFRAGATAHFVST